MKLGKRQARHDPRTLQMAQYLHPSTIPQIPGKAEWDHLVKSWPMMKNDALGDCTCAAAGHLIQGWTANASKEIVPTDADIVAAYSAITGYNPANPASDNGAVELDVLKYWRKHGIAGHKIKAFVALEPANHDHIKAAVYLLGGCYIGLALPLTAQEQNIWAVPPGGLHGKGEAGSWGGHAVPVVAYDAHGLVVVTWGQLKRMTWGFWRAYCDEAYALLSPDFFNPEDVAPNQFNLAQLESDLKLL